MDGFDMCRDAVEKKRIPNGNRTRTATPHHTLIYLQLMNALYVWVIFSARIRCILYTRNSLVQTPANDE